MASAVSKKIKQQLALPLAPAPKGGSHLFAAARLKACPDTNRDSRDLSDFIWVDDGRSCPDVAQSWKSAQAAPRQDTASAYRSCPEWKSARAASCQGMASAVPIMS